MRRFANDKVAGLMQKFGMEKDEAIEHPWVSRAIENAQRKVEGHNFDIRKNLLEYDDVANEQRKFVYNWRNEILDGADGEELQETLSDYREDVMSATIDKYIVPMTLEEQWNISGLIEELKENFDLDLPVDKWLAEDDTLAEETLRHKILNAFNDTHQEKQQKVGLERFNMFERNMLIQVVDNNWKEHLANMDYLRQGIHLRGYGQKDPKREYKRESFDMFSTMIDKSKQDAVMVIAKVQIQDAPPPPPEVDLSSFETSHANADEVDSNVTVDQKETLADLGFDPNLKVGRNDLCPCGSGEKYKRCHGAL
jgi:preprotein translocase subunit SecA